MFIVSQDRKYIDLLDEAYLFEESVFINSRERGKYDTVQNAQEELLNIAHAAENGQDVYWMTV